MSTIHRVAIIGLGVIGQRMLVNMPKHERLQIVGGWDVSDAARESAKHFFPSLDIAESAEALIARNDVDLVYIGTPPKAHAALARQAMAAGKAVFCEKPLGVDVSEGAALVAEAEANGARHAVNLSLAASHPVSIMLDAIDAGSLDPITGVDIRLRFSQWPRYWQKDAGSWLSHREEGGFVREVATHFIYLTELLLGHATLIDRSVRFPNDPNAAETHVLARLDCGGIPVTLAGSVGGAGPDLVDFSLWGKPLSYRLTTFHHLSHSTGGPWQETIPEIDDPVADARFRQLNHLVSMMDGQPHRLPKFAEALRIEKLVEAILA